ncbi:hypothetical protein [Flavobacterium sp.]|uniref:hypothetical protein n=1 Tax=Flavobacterium sp. TaxID=239 RepID=UPI0024897716|nr:hypothetical protein [Flavobacterium sp.]MDI1318094.1 hypothetical protein [Flavobacterium sp.]
MKNQEYKEIIVESFIINNSSGKHGLIHIRPLPNQFPFEEHMLVECSKVLITDFPVGTKFSIKAKITSREGGKEFIYSHYSWSYKVLKE